jgi:hypothetical protein
MVTTTNDPKPLKPKVPPPTDPAAAPRQPFTAGVGINPITGTSVTDGPVPDPVRPGQAVDAGQQPPAGHTNRLPPQRPAPPPRPQGRPAKRGIGELIKDLRDEAQALVRQEVALAKTEVGEKVEKLTSNLTYLAIGGVLLAAAGLLALLAVANLVSAIFEALGMVEWLAGAIGYGLVAAVIGGVGYVLLKKGLDHLKNQNLTPERTLDSLKEDKQWLTNKVK